jgi:hypothetical protein
MTISLTHWQQSTTLALCAASLALVSACGDGNTITTTASASGSGGATVGAGGATGTGAGGDGTGGVSTSVSSGSSSSAGTGGGMAQPAREIGAYLGASCTCSQGKTQADQALPGFSTWLGTTVNLGEDFLPAGTSWTDWAAPDWNLTGWKAWKAADAKHRLIVGPALGPTTDLAAGAAGNFDADWKLLGQRLVSAGLTDTTFRIAHEFSGDWYWYTPQGREAQFIGYWKHIVAALRSVPGQKFQFFWNPALGVSQQNGKPFHAEDAYPGDDVVDFIGPDIYDSVWSAYPTSGTITAAMNDAAWKELKTGDHGLDWYADFAKQHGKPVALGEWGVWAVGAHHGGGDDPAFIQRMYDWINAHDVAFHVYFEVVAGDGDHQLWPTTAFPKSAALFKQLF